MKPLIIHFLILCSLITFSQQKQSFDNSFNNTFIENKGQVIDQNNKPNQAVKYIANVQGMNVQLRQNGFSYDTYTSKKVENTISTIYDETDYNNSQKQYKLVLSVQRIDIDFVGANLQAKIIGEGEYSDHFNYYNGTNGDDGVQDVRHFGKVVYKEIYPKIDLEFITEKGKLKFNFILHQGADINNIRWQYKGANKVELRKGNIELFVKQGSFTENIPVSYFLEGEKKQTVKINYRQINQNTFGFENHLQIPFNTTLIIDPVPEILWSTYYGDIAETICFGVSHDKNDSILIAGSTNCFNNIATSGSYLSTVTVAGNGFIAKFNMFGNRLWATFYGVGGTSFSSIHSDYDGNIVAGGQTYSSYGISKIGAFQMNLAGATDAFVVKFSNSGNRLWATYYGGTYIEEYIQTAIDSIGNVYISGTTRSDTTTMVTPGAYQGCDNFNNSYYRGFLVKFDKNGIRKWGTYIRDTVHYSIKPMVLATAKGNYIYMGGRTQSYNFIATPGTFKPTLTRGDIEGFLMKFDSLGQRVWGTYYGGSDQYQNCQAWPYGLTTDLNGNAIMVGQSETSTNLASPGAHQTAMYGATDGYVVKFNLNGTRAWGTWYGGSNTEKIWGISTDLFGNAYCFGGTSSANNIATPNTPKPVNLDTIIGDAFYVKFNPNGVRIYGSYFGGNTGESGRACNIDNWGKLLLAGLTNSTIGIATSGAFNTVQGSNGNYVTGFLARLSDCIQPDTPSIVLSSNQICYGQSVNLTINGSLHDATKWNVYANGNLINSSSTTSYTYYPTQNTTYYIKGVGGCIVKSAGDSVQLIVHPLPMVFAGNDTIICKGNSVTLSASGTAVSYVWAASIPNGTVFTPSVSQQLPVVGTDIHSCKNSDTLSITLRNLPTITYINGFDSICEWAQPRPPYGGLPSGGSYSGFGLTAGIFYPHTAGLGYHPIVYTYTDNYGCTNTAKDSIYVAVCTSLQDLVSNQNIKVYPNPVKSILSIEFSSLQKDISITILNSMGQIVRVATIFDSCLKTMSLDGLAPGLYFYQIDSTDISHSSGSFLKE